MKVKKVITECIICLLVVVMIIVLSNVIFCIKVTKASDYINEYKQKEYLKINLYGKTWDEDITTISGLIQIIDNDGNKIAEIERSWSGAYLAVEFNIIIIDGGTYIFPCCVYGKKQIFEPKKISKKGTYLEKYYLDDGECLLLGKNSSKANRKHLFDIACFSKSKIPSFFLGKRLSYIVDLSQCNSGIQYTLNYTDENGFFLVED